MNNSVLEILIVDDDRNIRDGFRRVLRSSNLNLSFASTGSEAIDLAASKDFDLIICDEVMPGMAGTEVLKKFSERHPQTLRIMLSGKLTLHSLTNTVNSASLFRCFQKPVDPNTIIKAIRDAAEAVGKIERRSPSGERSAPYELDIEETGSADVILSEILENSKERGE